MPIDCSKMKIYVKKQLSQAMPGWSRDGQLNSTSEKASASLVHSKASDCTLPTFFVLIQVSRKLPAFCQCLELMTNCSSGVCSWTSPLHLRCASKWCLCKWMHLFQWNIWGIFLLSAYVVEYEIYFNSAFFLAVDNASMSYIQIQ
jgi:hypothetical protein